MKKYYSKFSPQLMIGLVIVFLVGGAISTTYFFKNDVLNQQRIKLQSEMDLLIPYLFEGETLDFEPEKLDASMTTKDRLTILDASGTIQYDTSHSSDAIGSREDRTEIQEILNEGKDEGFSVRDSETLNEKLLYASKAVYVDQELVAILRLSEKYSGVSNHLKRFQWIVFIALCVISVIILSMYFYILKQSQKPIQFILPILRNAIKNPDKKQAVIDAPSEWQELYQTVYDLMDETNLLYSKQLQNEEKLSFLFENLDIGIFILNNELEVTLANGVTESFFASSKKSLYYEDWFQHKKMNQLIQEAVQKNEQVQGDIHIQHPKNHQLNVVIRLLETTSTEYVGIIYDITEMKQMEKVHEDFISNISHELKTPTTSIIGFAETLLAGAKDDPATSEEFIQIIENEGKRLLGLIENIMMLLKTEKDIYMLDTVVSNPEVVVEEEIQRYLYKFTDKNINLFFDSKLPYHIELPGNAFQLIVKNLLENAIEYTSERDSIFIYLKELENDLVFTIEDTGIGISEEDQKRIFERFYRVSHSRQRNTGGSGLGLSIVQHYTEILGGTIKLFSDPGEGTTVIIKIPMNSQQEND